MEKITEALRSFVNFILSIVKQIRELVSNVRLQNDKH